MMRLPRCTDGVKQKLLGREADIEQLKAEGGISEGLKFKLSKGVLIVSQIVGQLDREIVITHLITGKEG